MLTYIERIEVALRAKLNDKYSLNHGFFWYTIYDLFEDKDLHDSINEYIKGYFENPQENFLKAYKYKYHSEQLPPSNMAMETLTFGKLSRLYQGLKNDSEKQEIAFEFGLPSTILSSWFIYINNVRNICAHHSRLWNKRITADRPTIPKRKRIQFNGEIPDNFNTTVYGVISIIDRLLKEINPSNSFVERIITLIDDYPSIKTNSMGFPTNWRDEPAWK